MKSVPFGFIQWYPWILEKFLYAWGVSFLEAYRQTFHELALFPALFYVFFAFSSFLFFFSHFIICIFRSFLIPIMSKAGYKPLVSDYAQYYFFMTISEMKSCNDLYF